MLEFIKFLDVRKVLQAIIIDFKTFDRIWSNKTESFKLSYFVMVYIEFFKLFEMFQTVNSTNLISICFQYLKIP